MSQGAPWQYTYTCCAAAKIRVGAKLRLPDPRRRDVISTLTSRTSPSATAFIHQLLLYTEQVYRPDGSRRQTPSTEIDCCIRISNFLVQIRQVHVGGSKHTRGSASTN